MDGKTPPASAFDTGAPTAQFVLPDQLNPSGRPTDWAGALAGLGPLNPVQAAPSPHAGGTPEISSTKPIRYLSRRIADQPQVSVFDTSRPAAPYVPGREAFALARRNACVSWSDAASRAGRAGGSSSMSGLQGSARSTLLEYIQRLKQLDANKPQASILDPDVSGGSLAPPDRPSPMGGLAGRIAALAGMDPDNPEQSVPPSGGLLARLLAAQR